MSNTPGQDPRTPQRPGTRPGPSALQPPCTHCVPTLGTPSGGAFENLGEKSPEPSSHVPRPLQNPSTQIKYDSLSGHPSIVDVSTVRKIIKAEISEEVVIISLEDVEGYLMQILDAHTQSNIKEIVKRMTRKKDELLDKWTQATSEAKVYDALLEILGNLAHELESKGIQTHYGFLDTSMHPLADGHGSKKPDVIMVDKDYVPYVENQLRNSEDYFIP